MTDKVRWGVLSTAHIGIEQVVPAIQQGRNCEVVAIASRDLGKGRIAADRLAIPEAHGSYEELLANQDIDAVYIPLPNHLHREWAIAAARAGKHVLGEKPLALSADEAQEIVDACADAGVKLMEAFMYRLHPSWAKVRELVASGAIGELRSVQTLFAYFNDDPANIRNQTETGGGALMDIGCYAINLSRMMFGSEPTRVEASVRRHPSFGTDIVTSAILEFGDGHAGFVVSTQTEDYQRVHLLGSDGRIEVEIPINIPPDRESRVFLTQGGDPPVDPHTTTITFPPANQYTIQAELFAQAILDDTPVPTPPSDAVANMRVIDQILEAATLPPSGGSTRTK